jgi:hypothetical protein
MCGIDLGLGHVQEQERKSRPAGHKRVATQGLLVVLLFFISILF